MQGRGDSDQQSVLQRGLTAVREQLLSLAMSEGREVENPAFSVLTKATGSKFAVKFSKTFCAEA